jgi:hypothetical protein
VEEQRKKAKTAGTKLERKNAKRTAKLIDETADSIQEHQRLLKRSNHIPKTSERSSARGG